jgi:hypothetical protein
LERNLTEEKTRNKKISNEQKRKIKILEVELDEIKTDNKSLEIRIRALNNELSVYKRGKGNSIGSRGRPIRTVRSRDSSRDSKRSNKSNNTRQPNTRQTRPPLYSRPTSASKSKNQLRSRDVSPCGSVRSVASSVGSKSSMRSGTSLSSNKSSRRPRFDPTAYIQAKKAKELDIKKNKRRSNSINSRKNSNQNVSSGSRYQSGIRSSTPDPLSLMTSEDEGEYESRPNQIDDSLIREGSFNIHEIDARLSALQQYMNDLAT